MEVGFRVSGSMQSPSRKGSCPFSWVYFYFWAIARDRGCWKVWWRNWGTVLCAQHGRRVPGRAAAVLGTERTRRHVTDPSWGDKDGSQEQPFGYWLSAKQLPQPVSTSPVLLQRGEGWDPAMVLAVGMHHGTRVGISSARGGPGGCAWQAHRFQEAYGQLCEDSTILVLRSPLSSLCRKESRESVLKDRFGADPVIRVGLTVVASGNILSDVLLTPADVCCLNCWTAVARSKAWPIKSQGLVLFLFISWSSGSRCPGEERCEWHWDWPTRDLLCPCGGTRDAFDHLASPLQSTGCCISPDCPGCDAACLLLLSVQNFICMKLMPF